MKKDKITLSFKELTFLAALMEGQTLLGVVDPFDGWLAHQVEEEWVKISPEMEAREFIRKQESGKIVVDDSIADIIKTCCFPESCVLLTRWTESNNNTNNCYYITGEMQVEKADDPPYSCTLTVLHNPSEIIKLMEKSFPVNNLTNDNPDGVELPSSFVESIRGYKKEEQKEALDLLQKKQPDFAIASQLVNALINPISYTILICSDFKTEPVSSYGFSVLEGQNYNWKLRSFNKNDEDWLEIEPLSEDILNQEMKRVSKKVTNIN